MGEYKGYYNSQLGTIEIKGNEDGIYSVKYINEDVNENTSASELNTHPYIEDWVKQLDEYFKGIRIEFDVKLQMEGTDFQRRVWKELYKIPFGKTVTYKEIALALGDEKAVRAVGNANGNNKINIIIPCHRVIGSNGKLTGYSGGLWRKEWLLNHEKVSK